MKNSLFRWTQLALAFLLLIAIMYTAVSDEWFSLTTDAWASQETCLSCPDMGCTGGALLCSVTTCNGQQYACYTGGQPHPL
jgi:hypothetical protein